jgi:hypothetical protein
MKAKILNLLLIVTSLFGYLEWGKDNQMFLFQGEYEIISKLFSDPGSVIHPFTVLPLVGQLLLLFTLFQREPGKGLTFAGVACIGLLLGFMFVIGILSGSIKILVSTLPFIFTSFIVIRRARKK